MNTKKKASKSHVALEAVVFDNSCRKTTFRG